MNRKRSAVLTLALALPPAAAAAGCSISAPAASVATPRHTVAAAQVAVSLPRHFLDVSGVRRSYLLEVPPARTRPAPLVIALHGLRGTAEWMAQATGLADAARRSGVVLAVPDSLGPAWNDGRLGPHGPDDASFLLALIAQLHGEGLIDAKRVVITGFSNGAEMTLVMAARYPHDFSGAVAVAGELLAGPAGARPSGPIPLWLVHGLTDPVQPVDGRPGHGHLWPMLQSEAATAIAFAHADGAATTPVRSAGPAGPAGHGAMTMDWYPGGAAPLVVISIPGGRHSWPVSDPRLAGPGRQVMGLDASTLVIQLATKPVAQSGTS